MKIKILVMMFVGHAGLNVKERLLTEDSKLPKLSSLKDKLKCTLKSLQKNIRSRLKISKTFASLNLFRTHPTPLLLKILSKNLRIGITKKNHMSDIDFFAIFHQMIEQLELDRILLCFSLMILQV